MKTTDFEDLVFKPYTMKEMNGVRRRHHRPGVPHTHRQPALHDARLVVRHSRRRHAEDGRRVRAKGAKVVVLLSHNGMDVDLKLASRVRGIDAILGGHTHDGVPGAIPVKNPGGTTLVTNAGSNSKFLGVLDFDVKDGKIADFRYKSCCRCSRTCCRRIPRWTR